MIVVYTAPGCASCRKVKKWLNERELPFIERNLYTTLLNEKEVRNLLLKSENGTDDIISKRSKLFQEIACDLDNMKTHEIIEFIQQNPSILKRPILVNEKSLVVGYDEDEIDVMIPSELRKISENSCSKSCPNFETCGRFRDELSY